MHKLSNAYPKAKGQQLRILRYTIFLLSCSCLAPDALTQELLLPLSRFDRDAGHWVGAHVGIQTNGASVKDRLSGMIHYEHRFRDAFGLLVALQLWKTRFQRYDGIQKYEYIASSGSLMAAMRFRFPFRFLTPNMTVGAGTGMGQAPVLLFYSIGAEASATPNIHFAVEIRRTTIQEDSFFIMVVSLFKL